MGLLVLGSCDDDDDDSPDVLVLSVPVVEAAVEGFAVFMCLVRFRGRFFECLPSATRCQNLFKRSRLAFRAFFTMSPSISAILDPIVAMAIPKSEMPDIPNMMVKSLPRLEVGQRSPYPTVVNVTTEKYKASIIDHGPSTEWYATTPKPR